MGRVASAGKLKVACCKGIDWPVCSITLTRHRLCHVHIDPLLLCRRVLRRKESAQWQRLNVLRIPGVGDPVGSPAKAILHRLIDIAG